MKETPLLFRAEMIRAILAGSKSQTRRIAKLTDSGRVKLGGKNWHPDDENAYLACPYGQKSDRIWCRETWAVQHYFDGHKPREIPADARVHYAATEDLGGLLKRVSIFLPRKFSRITLEIVSARVERLQDISEDDAIAEGVECPRLGAKCNGFIQGANTSLEPTECVCIDGYVPLYETLWESINGKGSWALNPLVWRIEFRKI